MDGSLAGDVFRRAKMACPARNRIARVDVERLATALSMEASNAQISVSSGIPVGRFGTTCIGYTMRCREQLYEQVKPLH